MNRFRGKPIESSDPRRLPSVSGVRFGRGRNSRFPSSVSIAMVAVLVLVVGIAALTTAVGGHSQRASVREKAVRRTATGYAIPTTTAAPVTTTTDPGSLPQTATFPTGDSTQFHSEMSALWNGIVTDSLSSSLPAFFPEGAYEQLKTVSDAQSDYEDRLVRDFSLDVTAAHHLLGAEASTVLVGVDVPAHYGHWVPPGVCDNRIGYFEVANARIVYEQDGVTHSFGIASLISWRGVWYVVHLGAILRSTATGVVEDPELGTGISEPSSTC